MKRLLVLGLSPLFHTLVFLRVFFWTAPRLALRTLWGGLYPEIRPFDDPDRANPSFSAEGAKEESRPYLMILSRLEWDGVWQRPQHLAMQLADSRKMDVVYCAPILVHDAGGRAARLFFRPAENARPGLEVIQPLVLPGENRSGFIRFLNHLILFDHLRRGVARRGAPPSVLMTNSPFFSLTFSWLPARLRVYDVMDEPTSHPRAPDNAAEQEQLTADQADLIATGAKSLYRLKRKQYGESGDPAGARVQYVPCGVEVEHFARPVDYPKADLPADVASLPHPIVGFMGALNERVNPEILETVARDISEGSLVLIGPVRGRFAQLRSMKNVFFLGLKSYSILPRYLSAFDCAVIPYRLGEGIEYVQPVKALEYLAGGKPVVSTAIPDLVELFREKIRIAGTAEDFASRVREALDEGGARARQYVEMARDRSWLDMAEDFVECFETAFERKNRGPRRIAHLLEGRHFRGADEVAMNLCARHEPAGPADGQTQGAEAPNQTDPPDAPWPYATEAVCLRNGRIVQNRLRQRGIPFHEVQTDGESDLGTALRLIPLLRARKIDLMHSHTGRTHLVGRVVSRLVHLPLVSTVHTPVARDINDLGRTNWRKALVERKTRSWSTALVFASARHRDAAVRSGLDHLKVFHVPDGVPLDGKIPDFAERDQLREKLGIPDDGAPLVGLVAAPRPRKGTEVLIRAMKRLTAEFPEARLLVVGSADQVEKIDYLAKLKGIARDCGVEENVIFTGHRDDVAALYSLMDVAVLPSLTDEGPPLAVLEAMAAEKPVVATRTEGNAEAVTHDETGLLVPPKNPDALAQAIGALLRDTGTAASMGRIGRRRVERDFDAQVMTRRYEAIYEAILDGG